jgi:hypothetical protein
MVETETFQYDNGGVGDSLITQMTLLTGGGSSDPDEVDQYFYDWRDRLVAEKDGVETTETDGVNRPIIFTTLDNLDERVEQQKREK